jgi:hypothetical protein
MSDWKSVRTGDKIHLPPMLTKRELFAAMAMQGILAHAASNWPVNDNPESLAQCAVHTADALLAELSKKEGRSE